jgi:CDGSH-type Zn-finger protein
MSASKPTINPLPDGPYLVEGLETLRNRAGQVETQPKIALCRCGKSSNKPFCDGTHAKIGFSSEKLNDRATDKRDDYAGPDVTIHDNRGICAHAGKCTEGLPAVFRYGQEPWIDPSGASQAEISKVIKTCPSGALSLTISGVEPQANEAGEITVFIAPGGPYVVSGAAELLDSEFGEGAPTEHFTLCRCGGSKNKPFCDGTHWNVEFDEDKG